MKKPYFYLDDDFLIFKFACNKHIMNSETIEKKDITLQYGSDGKDVFINIWKKRVLIVAQKLRFIKNQKYLIECFYTKINDTVRFNNANIKLELVNKNNEVETQYLCKKRLHPKDAKKRWKYIKKRGLVSKAYWDYEMDWYDWKCKGCDYHWLSNPDVGYVRHFDDDPDVDRGFHYIGKDFTRVEEWENNMLTFFNKEEWERKQKELDLKESFDELWELPFVRGSNEEVNRSNVPQGHWWRNKSNHDELVDDEYFASSDNPHYFEKVITYGWHSSHPSDAIPCPVCTDLDDIMNSGWLPLTPYQRFRSWLHWKLEERFLKKQNKKN